MAFEYIKKYYGVPADYGRRVIVNGKPGIIIKDNGHYIGVNFDHEKPGTVLNAHPTWMVEYLGFDKPRKPTRSQARYQKYLSLAECFDNFFEFLKWEAAENKKNNSNYFQLDSTI